MPNLESSFLDLRDPMTAPDGTTPTKPQVHRLTAGFALGALLFTAPMAALNSVLIPQTISRLSGTDRVTDLALLSVVGTLLTFLMTRGLPSDPTIRTARWAAAPRGSSPARC